MNSLTGDVAGDPSDTSGDYFVFKAEALDGLLDTVLDYNRAEGDMVDLTDLFDVATDGNVGDTVANFAAYNAVTGQLTVDVDGSKAGSAEVLASFTNTPANIQVLFTDSGTPGDDTAVI